MLKLKFYQDSEPGFWLVCHMTLETVSLVWTLTLGSLVPLALFKQTYKHTNLGAQNYKDLCSECLYCNNDQHCSTQKAISLSNHQLQMYGNFILQQENKLSLFRIQLHWAQRLLDFCLDSNSEFLKRGAGYLLHNFRRLFEYLKNFFLASSSNHYGVTPLIVVWGHESF